MQNLELIDSVIKACSDDPVQEQIESLCKAASDVMMEFYGYSLFDFNGFRVIATFEGKKADEEFGVSEAQIRAADAPPPFEAIAEWISDEVSDPLAITDIAHLESRPTLDDFQSKITVFTRYSNGEDSEENPPSPEEVDVMETTALLLSEAAIRMLFLGRQDAWDCEQ